MKLLLIDNSNTRTKFALSEPGGGLVESFWIPTAEISQERLNGALAELKFEASLICSVVPRYSSPPSRLPLASSFSKSA